MNIKVLLILLFTALYAVTRYVFFGNVPIIQIPVYILNKSLSMASSIYLLLAAWNHLKGKSESVKRWGMASWHVALLHILLSLAVFSGDYFPKFFGNGKMNLTGELTVLFGVLAFYCYWLLRKFKSDLTKIRSLQCYSALFIGAHLLVMGFVGWLEPSQWYGGLPPISLLCFIASLISMIFFLKPVETYSLKK